ncbi:MAG: hypothetical protein JRE23_13540 [Deltaproteobacteria bacterium]|nr:hypothetical protein [Deltaproteobacteria bacterium]
MEKGVFEKKGEIFKCKLFFSYLLEKRKMEQENLSKTKKRVGCKKTKWRQKKAKKLKNSKIKNLSEKKVWR